MGNEREMAQEGGVGITPKTFAPAQCSNGGPGEWKIAPPLPVINCKGLFIWNGSVPFGDPFYCKKRVFSVMKRKETVICMGERNGTVPTEQALSRILKAIDR